MLQLHTGPYYRRGNCSISLWPQQQKQYQFVWDDQDGNVIVSAVEVYVADT